MYLVIGILAALLEARTSGEGQVVDAAIVDGAAHLSRCPRMLAGGLARRSGPRTCSTGACPSTTSTRPPTAGTSRSGRWSRRSTTPCSRGSGARRRRTGGTWRGTTSCAHSSPSGSLPHPGPVDRDVRRHRRLRARPSCPSARRPSTRTSPPGGAARGAPGAGAGAALLPDAGRLASGPSVAGGDTRAALAAWGMADVEGLLASGAAVQTD